jgi:hypothetical protein
MNVYEQVKQPIARIVSSQVAIVLILSTILWMTGLPLLVNRADAAQLTNVSDTLSDSNLGAGTKHVIRYTTASSTPAGGTIKIQFDAATSLFSQVFSTATTTDYTATGMHVVANAAGCDGTNSDQVYPVGNFNNGTDENVTFVVCTSDTVAVGAKVITIGAATSTPLITNPATTGSYRVTVSGSNSDYGDTRVAVLTNVTVTAAVDTSFTFTVAGLATSTVVNGETLNGTASSTSIAFGTLAPGVPQIRGQRLTVITNAANGFSVTVVENQNLLSATGADIDLFADGTLTATPASWSSPLNTLGSENTYGHIGVTSDDASTSNGNEFTNGGTKYAGNFAPGGPRQLFYHNLPSNGTGTGVGTTDVAYKVEVASLQEAGSDYTNTLTYVATPVF